MIFEATQSYEGSVFGHSGVLYRIFGQMLVVHASDPQGTSDL